MRLPTTRLGQYKTLIHIIQAAIVALGIILTITVFATSGSTDGRTGWYFGLCWLTAVLLVYQTMVTTWAPTRRFANIFAFVTIDCLGVVLWLSGWAAVTSYVVEGKGKGANDKESGCGNFKFGSRLKCEVSEATIVLGVLIMLLFIATALISFKDVMEYKRTGALPSQLTNSTGAGPLGGMKPTHAPGHHTDEEAFDTNMNLRQDWEVDEYDHDEYHDRYGGRGGSSANQDFTSPNLGLGAGANPYGYAPAQMHDFEESHETAPYDSHRPRAVSPRPQSHSPYLDDQDPDLGGRRPTSTGHGPLGADTRYLPTYEPHR